MIRGILFLLGVALGIGLFFIILDGLECGEPWAWGLLAVLVIAIAGAIGYAHFGNSIW